MPIGRKDITEIHRQLRRQGWTLVRTARHMQAIPPDPRAPICHLPVGQTSEYRALANVIAQLRRSGFTWQGR